MKLPQCNETLPVFDTAIAELADGKSDAALLTLVPLQTYCQVCRKKLCLCLNRLHINPIRI